MKEKRSLFSKGKDYVAGLDHNKRVQLLAASALTLSMIVAVPVYAWFVFSSRYDSLTKIQKPETLDIKAGHADAIINLNLSDIDATKKKDNAYQKYYVFSVVASAVESYDIQVAHTTNIPFTYELYRANQSEADTAIADSVVSYDAADGHTYNYSLGESVGLVNKNPDSGSTGRVIANNSSANTYYNNTYETGADADTPELYAVPIYAQTKDSGINTINADHDYFILKLSWTVDKNNNAAYAPYADWNYAKNNKETDIIYIAARAHVN